jgi:hypothetical protein
MGGAIQWYENLRSLVRRALEEMLCKGANAVREFEHSLLGDIEGTLIHRDKPTKTQCARILQLRCPACFGGSIYRISEQYQDK